MKKTLVLFLLCMGLSVGLNADEMTANAQADKRNDYIYDDAQGYAIPSGTYCQKYIDMIKEKDEQIKVLKQEISSFQGGEQQDLQKQIKAKYDKEMKEIEEKRSNRAKKDTTSRIIISDKPVP